MFAEQKNVMELLFELFETAEIRYLHFKSNTDIDLSFEGKADFDILVDKNRLTDIETAILSLRGRRHNPEHIGSYPGVDNWLLMDMNSGIIYHLHLHYQLVTGKSLVKDYAIPWEELLFSTRIKDEKNRLYITEPSLELILLSVRLVLKSKFHTNLMSYIGYYRMGGGMMHEWKDLQKKTDWNKVSCLLRQSMTWRKAERYICVIRKDYLNSRDYRWLSRVVRRQMKVNRRYNVFVSSWLAFRNRATDLINKFRSRYLGGIPITKKVCLSGGKIFAFVGVDGAGKSTVTNEINRWINKKIECKRFYMGVGDGHTTLLGSILKKAASHSQEVVKPKAKKKQTERISFWKQPLQYVKRLLKLLLICDVERNNRKKLLKMQRYKLNGGISLLDRYPQIELPGQNDGPKVGTYIQILGRNMITKMLERKEKTRLGIVTEIRPDAVFRLNISPETSKNRKPEQSDILENKKKIDDLRSIHFQGVKIYEVNAELPYEEELLSIKRILWELI